GGPRSGGHQGRDRPTRRSSLDSTVAGGIGGPLPAGGLPAVAWIESRGMADLVLVRLTEQPLDPSEALSFVSDGAAGGTVLFSGTVRDHSVAGPVTGLDYEAW